MGDESQTNELMAMNEFKKEMWEKLVRLELKTTVLAEQLYEEKQINNSLYQRLHRLCKPDVYLDVLYRAYKRAIEHGRDDVSAEDLDSIMNEL